MAGRQMTVRQQVFQHLTRHGDKTGKEISEALGLTIHQAHKYAGEWRKIREAAEETDEDGQEEESEDTEGEDLDAGELAELVAELLLENRRLKRLLKGRAR